MLPAIFFSFSSCSCSARFVLIVNFVFHLPALRSWPSFCIFVWLVVCRVYYPVLFVYYPVFFSWSDLSLIFFHSLTSLQIFLLFPRYCSFRFSLGFYSHFVLFLCRLLPLLYRCCRYRLSRVSDFLPDFPIVFFQVVSSIYSLSDFPRYPHYFSLPSCNLLLPVFLCNFPRFFLIFLHSSVFDWNNVVFFLQTWIFCSICSRHNGTVSALEDHIMSITHVENNNQAQYEAIRRVCLWRVQMRVIVHCATFSHNISN